MLMLIVLAAAVLFLSCALFFSYIERVRLMDARDALKCEVGQLKANAAMLTDALRAERAITGDYDKALDEALELISSGHHIFHTGNKVIVSQGEMLQRYESMVHDKLFTLATDVLERLGPSDRTWKRGEQHSISGDTN